MPDSIDYEAEVRNDGWKAGPNGIWSRPGGGRTYATAQEVYEGEKPNQEELDCQEQCKAAGWHLMNGEWGHAGRIERYKSGYACYQAELAPKDQPNP